MFQTPSALLRDKFCGADNLRPPEGVLQYKDGSLLQAPMKLNCGVGIREGTCGMLDEAFT